MKRTRDKRVRSEREVERWKGEKEGRWEEEDIDVETLG
eukprot:CAMPEP_0182517668 /NCGR_PEP_ID=MMETSP1321-20130603/42718_1 /TAXON_ID=91990 /ORGANISM="Bolidomonas sp., Strain RCC1657" /LENGTH=37 /DNA_ID= /DNA_START= /DNA_END= /DNA_ORIENTATION=